MEKYEGMAANGWEELLLLIDGSPDSIWQTHTHCLSFSLSLRFGTFAKALQCFASRLNRLNLYTSPVLRLYVYWQNINDFWYKTDGTPKHTFGRPELESLTYHMYVQIIPSLPHMDSLIDLNVKHPNIGALYELWKKFWTLFSVRALVV